MQEAQAVLIRHLRALAESVGDIEGGYCGSLELSREMAARLDELERSLNGEDVVPEDGELLAQRIHAEANPPRPPAKPVDRALDPAWYSIEFQSQR